MKVMVREAAKKKAFPPPSSLMAVENISKQEERRYGKGREEGVGRVIGA